MKLLSRTKWKFSLVVSALTAFNWSQSAADAEPCIVPPENMDQVRVYLEDVSYELDQVIARIVAAGDLEGAKVLLTQDGVQRAIGTLAPSGGYSAALCELPLPRRNRWNGDWGTVEVEGYGQACPLDLRDFVPFFDAIQAFAASDHSPPPRENHYIVFYGSSSMRLWETLQADFAPLPVLNRGFGGSTAPQARFFAETVLTPLRPRIVVLYEGDNDLTQVDAPRLLASYRQLLDEIRHLLPDTTIVLLPVKPSPLRLQQDLMAEILRANAGIAAMASDKDDIHFVDTAAALLDENGKLRESAFAEDLLHLNLEGYAIWTSVLRPVLEKLSARSDASTDENLNLKN